MSDEPIIIGRMALHPDGRVDWIQDSGLRLDSSIRIPPPDEINNAAGVADALRALADHVAGKPRDALDLMHDVRNHPDTVWGTVFVWKDVLEELQQLREDGLVPQALTDEAIEDYSHTLGKTLEIRCMEVSHWSEGLADALMDIGREDFGG